MNERGYLLIVLHGHQPFVRHPEWEYAYEESWLFEAITECYLPLLDLCNRLVCDGLDGKLTLSLTPCLCAMLRDRHHQTRYLRYLDDRLAFLDREIGRHDKRSQLGHLARMYFARIRRCREMSCNIDLTAGFARLQRLGAIRLLASAATHAYLPLWQLYPEIVRLQINVGIHEYESTFGVRPTGFWLPECGYDRGLDKSLRDAGIQHTFLNRNGVSHADPSPRYGEFAPVRTPRGLVAFGRDVKTHDQVWLEDQGYPGDSRYAGFRGDIGMVWSQEFIMQLTHQDHRVPTGLRYYRQRQDRFTELYDPRAAFVVCAEHADHFVRQCRQRVAELHDQLGIKPVIVALFDMEHFGHWWHEGLTWLDLVIRKLAGQPEIVRLITADEYLDLGASIQQASPTLSSWGYQDYSETWLMERNHWIYPAVYQEIEAFRSLVQSKSKLHHCRRAILNQYLRELLLAQASDWAFMLHRETAMEYARSRVFTHLDRMAQIRKQLENGHVDQTWIEHISAIDTIFADCDLFDIYSRSL